MGIQENFLTAIVCLAASCSTVSGTEYSLQRCKELAESNNVIVTGAALEVRASRQVQREVATKFFPKIDAQAVTFRAKSPLVEARIPSMNLPVYDGNPANLAQPTQFTYVPEIPVSALDKGTFGTVTAMQPLFAGGRIANGYRLSKIGLEVNEEKLALARDEVVRTTEERYWQLVALHEKMATLDCYQALLDTLYKDASVSLDAGLINRNDLLKVSIKQCELATNRLQIGNGIRLATMAFCQYLGIPYDSQLVLTDSIGTCSIPAEVYVDPQSALKQRHEYRLLQNAIKAEKVQTQLKIGEYLPEIAVGVGGLYLLDLGNDGPNGFLMASAKVPLSAWWEGSHSVSERKIREEIVKQNCKNNLELLQLQIEKTWSELDEKYKRVDLAQKTMHQVTENLKVNSDNYKAGLVNISDMLEAQALYKKGKDDLLDASIGYKVKLVTYLQMTGRE